MYTIRFWNTANENIKVGGQYAFDFETEEEAWSAAAGLAKAALKKGAVDVDMNNKFYEIIDDEEKK